ncbi:Gfo/Idh/MocA family protein [Christensenella intestinihominis]|uniref:Gfo/Idh/MocA family protein n=1 Tax=Christensenella intestinihominis TaxID=1851429 RepID=UPI0008368A86|nr:Gfo/Idh/MocA family oxidoreductase [Christensenella intestinihominis]
MKLLIHGCGYIGEVHLKTVLNNHLCEVALCEMNGQRRKEVAEKYGIDETYTSLDEALKHSFDGVVICTPNFAHKDDLEKCVKAGLNVMLEKPMSSTLESAREMRELCRKYDKFAFVAYCLRFAQPYQRIKKMVTEGKLGKVFGIHASVAGKKAITDAKTDYRTKRALGGGVISDFSHEIDYALWFGGKPVKNVKCFGARAIHKEWDVLDTAELLISCEDDLCIAIHMDFLQPYFGRSIEIYGTEGAIRWRDNESIKFYDCKKDKWIEMDSAIDWDDVYREEMEHYLHCLQTGEKPMIDAENGFETFEVIDKCVQDAEKGVF